MKLNYKRTILVGFAFFLISAFWQAYDATIPVILTNKFGMSQTWSGLIMAIDNILAVFMLPIFGSISDKCRSPKGKRTPFITIGTIIAAIALVSLSVVDIVQLKNVSDVAKIDDPAALSVIYDKQADTTLKTPEGKEFILSELMDKETFVSIRSQIVEPSGEKSTSKDYTNYVVPARQACAAEATAAQPVTLILFIVLLLAVLIAMATFRSPAVALMPDVTIKPLRSKANAIINLMGTAGGILVLVLGMVFATSAVKNAMMSYIVYYGVVAAIMLAALGIFRLAVKEPAWAAQMQADSERLGIDEEEDENAKRSGSRKLTRGELGSLLLILASIALWYIGYNAVTSKYSLYASAVLGMDYNSTLLIAQGAAIISYLPAGIVASKIGRKKTILAGVVMLSSAFAVASFMRIGSPALLMNVLFALAGIGWATINVNSFPMVVELCSGGDIGKYTGYYYTASMAAQIVTPILSGYLMDNLGMTILFPYAAVFAALAFGTMFFVKHGDAKPQSKKGLEALDIDD
jgi:MFS family permease